MTVNNRKMYLNSVNYDYIILLHPNRSYGRLMSWAEYVIIGLFNRHFRCVLFKYEHISR